MAAKAASETGFRAHVARFQMIVQLQFSEKDFEEFFTDKEVLDMNRFENFGIIKNEGNFSTDKVNLFSNSISEFKKKKKWNKEQIVELFFKMIPDFGHKETGKYLDSKM